MKKRARIVITLIIAVVPLLIALEGGYGLAPLEKRVARYNGPANGSDFATAIAVDSSGNVYVTGQSMGPSGDYDYATIKYNADGKQLWAKRSKGPGNGYNSPGAIAVDGSGNVYVAGSGSGSGTKDDYATVKYNAHGGQLWASRYNGPVNGWDYSSAIAVDGSGNVYVTGQSWGSGVYYPNDYATIKYNANGKQLWANRYNGPANWDDKAKAIAVDGSGNVYVTGESSGSGSADDYVTIKYSANGKQLWVKRYNGPSGINDRARALAVDGSGNVYVTGGTGQDNFWDYGTIKYSTNGKQLWVNTYSGPGNSNDEAAAIAVDGSGNVYVTGKSAVSGLLDDYATIKYSASGQRLWVKRYNGPANGDDEAKALALDGSGNVYITGWSASSGADLDYVTIKYDTNGQQLWVKRYNGPANGTDYARAIAVDGSGNVYITGLSLGSGTGYDYATIKY